MLLLAREAHGVSQAALSGRRRDAAALAVVIALGFLESRSRVAVRSRRLGSTTLGGAGAGPGAGLLTDAETGQRGYLLTLDESYLEPNEQATAALPAVLARLRDLTADNPDSNRSHNSIGWRPRGWTRIRDSVALAKSGERDRAVKTVVEGRGKALMTEIRALIQTATAEKSGCCGSARRASRIDRAARPGKPRF